MTEQGDSRTPTYKDMLGLFLANVPMGNLVEHDEIVNYWKDQGLAVERRNISDVVIRGELGYMYKVVSPLLLRSTGAEYIQGGTGFKARDYEKRAPGSGAHEMF